MNDTNTKILCTLGPAFDALSDQEIGEYLSNNNLYFRTNFSFGTHHEHLHRLTRIKTCAKTVGVHTYFLADLKGHKVRINPIEEQTIKVGDDLMVEYTSDETEFISTPKTIGVAVREYFHLKAHKLIGSKILLGDGAPILQITHLNQETSLSCKVITGGVIKTGMGFSIAGYEETNQEFLTSKDEADLKFIVNSKEWNAIVCSFVKTAQDVDVMFANIHRIDPECNMKVVAKIETQSAVYNIADIADASDAIMLARGDLYLKLTDPFSLGIVCRQIITECKKAEVPIIYATQNMIYMHKTGVPSRTEVTHITDTTLQLVDAIMLSEESAVSEFVSVIIPTLTSIIRATENSVSWFTSCLNHALTSENPRIAEDVSYRDKNIRFDTAKLDKELEDDDNGHKSHEIQSVINNKFAYKIFFGKFDEFNEFFMYSGTVFVNKKE